MRGLVSQVLGLLIPSLLMCLSAGLLQAIEDPAVRIEPLQH